MKKLFQMYNLRAVKCRGLACPNTLPFQLKISVPTCEANILMKRRFMNYIYKEFPVLYEDIIAETNNDINKFASVFKRNHLNGSNYSLVSSFCGRARPNFRLYWSIFVPKTYKEIKEITFQNKLEFPEIVTKSECLFIDD